MQLAIWLTAVGLFSGLWWWQRRQPLVVGALGGLLLAPTLAFYPGWGYIKLIPVISAIPSFVFVGDSDGTDMVDLLWWFVGVPYLITATVLAVATSIVARFLPPDDGSWT